MYFIVKDEDDNCFEDKKELNTNELEYIHERWTLCCATELGWLLQTFEPVPKKFYRGQFYDKW